MRQRSSYQKSFRAQVVQEFLQPGATLSSVAISQHVVDGASSWTEHMPSWMSPEIPTLIRQREEARASSLYVPFGLEAAYAQAEALRERHFQTGVIKSSNLKPKDSDRRARILNELAELPFKLYFTVVDKSRIHKDGGLRIKTSFIKYVNGLLYERLFRAYPGTRASYLPFAL